MRLVTMNIWGVRGDWDSRRSILAEGLRELSPDLVALQETVLREDHDQVRDLLGEEFHLVHGTCREPDGSGVGVASRWPITRVGS
jgi:exonuclease III